MDRPEASPLFGATATPAQRRRLAMRTGGYCVLLLIAAGWLMFVDLGGARMEGDEARYALCTDQILRTGQWLSSSPHPPHPYFEKPPLYMWLTAATHQWIPGLELKHRVWSAGFGVLCVIGTCLLGAVLLTPEAGALAAGALLTNRAFLQRHGARDGVMDAGLTLLFLVILLLYAATWHSRRGRLWALWVGIGAAAGLACLFKPLMGAPMLLLVGGHAVLFRRHLDWGRGAWMNGAAAASACVVVAAPWHLVQWHRFGSVFTQAFFARTLYQRAIGGLDEAHLAGPMFYLREITASSPLFALAAPGVVWAVMAGCAARRSAGHWSARLGLLIVAAVGWVGLFTMSRSKLPHYVYPAFPAIALCIAGGFAAAVEGASGAAAKRATARQGGCVRAAAWIAAGGFVLIACCRLGYQVLPLRQKKYVPWELFQIFAPAIADGEARLLFYDLPAAPEQWGDEALLDSADMFYLSHMRGMERVTDEADFRRLLADGRPSIAFIARGGGLIPAADPTLRMRFDPRFTFEHRAFTAAAIDIDRLLIQRLDLTTTNAPASPSLALLSPTAAPGPGGVAFESEFTVRAAPPLPTDFQVLAAIAAADENAAAATIQQVIAVEGDRPDDPVPLPFTGEIQLAAALRARRKNPSAPRIIHFRLTPPTAGVDANPNPDRGRLLSIQLIALPRPPIEGP